MVKKGSSISSRVNKFIKKRYISKNHAPKLGQIVKDVALMKGMLNSEKKRITAYTQLQTVGQFNGNSQSIIFSDITPAPAEGLTFSTRNGASIKLHSSFLEFQFSHQANTINNIKGSIYIVKTKGPAVSVGTAVTQFFQPNIFIQGVTVYDYNSQRNPDFFSQFQVICKRNFTVAADQLANADPIKNVKIPLKYNRGNGHHIRFSGDTTTVANGQILMFIVCDSGNINAITTTTLATGGAQYGVLTGLEVSSNFTHYYYDN